MKRAAWALLLVAPIAAGAVAKAALEPARPSGPTTQLASFQSRALRGRVRLVVDLRQAFRVHPTFFSFYVGRGDARFRSENLQLHRELVRAGIPHVFKLYAGAHGQRVWSARACVRLRLALAHLTSVTRSEPPAGLSGFVQVAEGAAGGVVLSGRIPNTIALWDRRRSAVYLPPGFQAGSRYPVIFLLHGFPGSPSGFYDSLQLAKVADQLISAHRVVPFVAVMPVAGRVTGKRSDEEWAGQWETYLVRDVVPWAAAHLPLRTQQADRAIAGLSAGAFGAVDIALRNSGLFGVAESWSGYFRPFRDGPLAHATASELTAHDPIALARRKAALLRRQHVRFYLATGFNHGGIFRRWTYEFARELHGLGLPYRVWASRSPDGGKYLRLQLPAALEFAFGAKANWD